MPESTEIDTMEEPVVKATIMTPTEYVGSIMELLPGQEGHLPWDGLFGSYRVILNYEMPLNEIIYDFFDALKSRTKGYALTTS